MLFIRDQCGILLLRVWWLATNTLYAKFFVVYYWHEKTIDKCSQIFHGWNIDVAKEYQIKTLQSIVNMFEIYYIYGYSVYKMSEIQKGILVLLTFNQ